MRPQIVARSARTLGRRANSSKAQNPLENPQVKQAVEQASAIYNQGASAVKRVAGPVGDRLGSLLGGE
jgi:F-type H+-transporting ATPase subunit g